MSQTSAPSGTPNGELKRVLQKVADRATVEQYRQIGDAVKASALLADQLNDLAASGRLTDIVVVTSATEATSPKPGPFSAWTTGTSIVFTGTLLTQLTKNRESDVVYPGDILPNNTTFVLAHLAYHLTATLPKPERFPVMQSYVAAMLDHEARAYIHAWNDTLDAAVRQNGNQALTPGQVGRFMLNMRYRFVFTKALAQATDKLEIASSGVIEESEANAKAVVTALETSSIADIQ